MIAWFWNVLIWIDQGVNVILGPVLNLLLRPENGLFGDPDETLSSVFGKNKKNCKACRILCLILHFLDKDHCERSIELDEG